eukprot:sb/3476435/
MHNRTTVIQRLTWNRNQLFQKQARTATRWKALGGLAAAVHLMPPSHSATVVGDPQSGIQPLFHDTESEVQNGHKAIEGEGLEKKVNLITVVKLAQLAHARQRAEESELKMVPPEDNL